MLLSIFRTSTRLCAVATASPSAAAANTVKTASPAARKLHVGVVEAPFNKGQPKEGVKDGPRAIKDTGVLAELRNLGADVLEYGPVAPEEDDDSSSPPSSGPDGERHHRAVLSYNRRLAASVARVVREGRLCLTLGGDHSVAIGTLGGHADALPGHQVVVLWVDAHADLNTGSSSRSGNMHGMPVAHLLRELRGLVNRRGPDDWPRPCLSAEHIAYVGLRDLDEAERKLLDDLGILWFGMPEIDKFGVSSVISRCLEHLKPSPTRPLHLSFDIDSLDPKEAPSTGTPVRGGLSLREALTISEAVRNTGLLRALDVVEVNPGLGSPGDAALTADAARLLILSFLVGYRGA